MTEESNEHESSKQDDFPVATIKPKVSLWRRLMGGSRMWIVTAICALVAVALLIAAYGSSGTHIRIAFEDGHGIKPGDTLRFRGIDVGEVVRVNVNSNLHGVTIHVELNDNASELAREGSQFWIERPQVGLARISGLDTVVGAKYVGVIPGEESGGSQRDFVGIESPPVLRDGSSSQVIIRFDDGHGIATGDVVRHLGIVIGEVTAVHIASDLDSVTMHVRLSESAAKVARAGSQFWIERPELGLSEIRGLETLIRGPYIDFLPGPENGPVVRSFQGLTHAPPAVRQPEGLEVLLISNQQRALKPGVPVTYRGLEVGHVVSVGLASDASSVQARLYIEPDFKSLVRVNSKFWSNIGLDASFRVTGGFDLKTDSLQSLSVGSIGFATPNNYGRKARTEDRFNCESNYDEDWLEWNPQIAVGQQMLPSGSSKPVPLRVTMSWKRKRLGFTREKQQLGWLLLLDSRELIGLNRFLDSPDNALDDSTMLEMSGTQFPMDESKISVRSNGLAMYGIGQQLTQIPTWPKSKIRRPTEAEECLIVADPQAPVTPLSAGKIVEIVDDRMKLDPSLSYDAAFDGACVVARSDGSLLGFLDLSQGQAVVVLASQ